MATIVECFSINNVARITLHGAKIVDNVDENGMIFKEKDVGMVENLDVTLSPYKSYKDIQDKMSEMKLKYVHQDGFLFLVTDECNLFGSRFLHKVSENNIITMIKVGENCIYSEDESKYDENIFQKIDIVYRTLSDEGNKPDSSEKELLLKTVQSIKRTYKNTGIITKDDLTWLNDIYKNYS